MKKPRISPLVPITILCVSFTLGFFAGRNTGRGDVLVRTASEATTSATQNITDPESPRLVTQSDTSPDVSESVSTEESSEIPSEQNDSGLININTATQSQLMTLPGIGEVLAGRIIDYREQYGPFSYPEQLLNVKGIGNKKLAAILEYITTGG